MSGPFSLSFLPQARADTIEVAVASGDTEIGKISFFCRTGQALVPSPDALFCLGLYPAAEVGVPLHVAGTVDPELFARAQQIQSMFKTWWPGCRPKGASAGTERWTAQERRPGVGLFFSGGVDSTFSLLDAQDRLTALITLLGPDIPLSDQRATDELEARCRRVATAHGLMPIVIETNVSTLLHPFASWIELHGSALAAIGHLLTDHIGQILIASSGNETAWSVPWGSHPGLDPLFSSTCLQVEHHGLVSRFDKIARIAQNEALLADLRVCNKARINCGICDKCTFAMRSLDLLGATQRARSFPPTARGRGRVKVVDDAFLDEVGHLLSAAERLERTEMAQEFRAVIRTYNRRKRLFGSGRRAIKSWVRILRHRFRWRRAGR